MEDQVGLGYNIRPAGQVRGLKYTIFSIFYTILSFQPDPRANLPKTASVEWDSLLTPLYQPYQASKRMCARTC